MNTEGEGWNHNQNVAWLLPRISADSCQWRQLTSSSVLLGRRLSLLDRIRGGGPHRRGTRGARQHGEFHPRERPNWLKGEAAASSSYVWSIIFFLFWRFGNKFLICSRGRGLRCAEMVRGWDFWVATISVSRHTGLWLNLLRDVREMRRGILLGACAVLFVRARN